MLLLLHLHVALAAPGAAAQAPQVLLVPLQLTTEQSFDNQYAATIALGTPPQKPFVMVVDTGSNTTWVPAPSCKSDTCLQRARFNPRASSTAKLLPDADFWIAYGGGTRTVADGVSDLMSFPAATVASAAGQGEPQPSAPPRKAAPARAFRQTFGIATTLQEVNRSDTQKQTYDGFMGMSVPQGTEDDAALPLVSMRKQGIIPRAVFGLFLNNSASNTSGGAGSAGELALGGFNEARIAGDITWLDVVGQDTDPGFWVVPMQAIRLAFNNGTTTPAVRGACTGVDRGGVPCVAVLDSGTSTIIGSMEQVAALNQALGGELSADMSMDCSKLADSVITQTQAALDLDNDQQQQDALAQLCSQYDPPEALVCGAVSSMVQGITASVTAAMNPDFTGQAQKRQTVYLTKLATEKFDNLYSIVPRWCAAAPWAAPDNVVLPCEDGQSARLPNVSFVFGADGVARAFNVTPDDYLDETVIDTTALRRRRPSTKTCTSRFTGDINLPQGAWLVGYPLLSNLYSIYDADAVSSPRVGLAQLRQPAPAAAPAAKPQQAVKSTSHTASVHPLPVHIALAAACAWLAAAWAL